MSDETSKSMKIFAILKYAAAAYAESGEKGHLFDDYKGDSTV